MAIKQLKLNVQSLLKKYASKKDNSKAIVKAITPILKDNGVKNELGLRMIDAIIERTLKGYDKNNKSFKEYSKAYIESTIFKIYRKSPGKVNLKLTGDMQAAIDVIKIDGDNIVIGITDELEANKAEGHIKGANHLPIRDFWGFPQEEIQFIILEDVIKEYNSSALSNIEIPLNVQVGEQNITL